ncbi:hypothetical protein B0H13DRAFT_2261255 [Mycena leptocephala]|nr:hypothetical protein B0H13DRAFT_2261255 [Mycena leptocephala]
MDERGLSLAWARSWWKYAAKRVSGASESAGVARTRERQGVVRAEDQTPTSKAKETSAKPRRERHLARLGIIGRPGMLRGAHRKTPSKGRRAGNELSQARLEGAMHCRRCEKEKAEPPYERGKGNEGQTQRKHGRQADEVKRVKRYEYCYKRAVKLEGAPRLGMTDRHSSTSADSDDQVQGNEEMSKICTRSAIMISRGTNRMPSRPQFLAKKWTARAQFCAEFVRGSITVKTLATSITAGARPRYC